MTNFFNSSLWECIKCFFGCLSGVIVAGFVICLCLSSCSVSYTYINQKYASSDKVKNSVRETSDGSACLPSSCDTLFVKSL